MHGKILYALIAKGTFVLAEYETSLDEAGRETDNINPVPNCTHDVNDLLGLDGNNTWNAYHNQSPETVTNASSHEDFASLARKVLGRISRSPGMHSYLYGSYMFTYAVRSDLLLMCISYSTHGHDVPSCFLTELLGRPELVRTGEASVLTRVLRDMLECKPDYQSSAGLFGTAARLAEAEEKLDSVTTVVKDNIRKVISRSENIDALLSKASDLSTEAFTFRDSSRQLHRQLWFGSLRARATILSSVAIFFLVLVSFFFLCRAPWIVSDVSICSIF